jgi:hypothetical protein
MPDSAARLRALRNTRPRVTLYLTVAGEPDCCDLTPERFLDWWEEFFLVLPGERGEGAFAAEETEALNRVDCAWQALVMQTPDRPESFDQLQGAPAWPPFAQACREALTALEGGGFS